MKEKKVTRTSNNKEQSPKRVQKDYITNLMQLHQPLLAMDYFSMFEHATLGGVSHRAVMTRKHLSFMFIHMEVVMRFLIKAPAADPTIKTKLSRVDLHVAT